MGKKKKIKIIKTSELPDERQETTPVFIMDKEIKRKIRKGEETNLEEIAKEDEKSENTEKRQATKKRKE